MIFRIKKSNYKWTALDYGLAEAYNIYESERCPQCGTHAWHAYSHDQNIKFEINETKCEACVVLDEHNEKQKDRKPGVTPSIKTGVYIEGEPLPGRNDWFVEMAAHAKAVADRKKKKEQGQ